MNKLFCLNLINIGLVILAISGTFFGGIVFAFDKSLWPLDGQILYIGHFSHVLLIPSSAVAFTKGYGATPRPHAAWLVTQGIIFVLALTAFILLYQGMFNYGWWPS
ncbi:MAG: hypothetical protein NZ744_08815 [Pirellulaceae bacterium]|nr:hypothetical protein [Pirellulaceae bacterium]